MSSTPSADKTSGPAKFSATMATSIVIANMIGTGVFTSLGFQLLDIQSAPVIILLWLIGGLLALCGALCYAELGAKLPRSGGEYNFLSEIYHPGVGFIAGWISATVGFAAPTALAAITAATYAKAVWPELPVTLVATALVMLIGAVHLGSRAGSARFQLAFTAIKVMLIVGFIFGAWFAAPELQNIRWAPASSDLALIGSGGFAIALIYVNYAYTGWNAATYLSGELAKPRSQLPTILLTGTTLVTVLYVLLHVTFLSVAPMSAMQGQLEIGHIVADYAFGQMGSELVAAMLAVLLVSTVSAMIIAGPRALQVIGEDFRGLRFLSRVNRSGVPYRAIMFQTAVTVVMVVTATFESILVFSGFILALNTLFAVFGVVLLRRRKLLSSEGEFVAGNADAEADPGERTFGVPWYPIPVVVFVCIMLWTLIYVVIQRPIEALVGLGLITAGWLFYLLTKAIRPVTL